MPSQYGRWVPQVGYADDKSGTVWAGGSVKAWVNKLGYTYDPKDGSVSSVEALEPGRREIAAEYQKRAAKLFSAPQPSEQSAMPKPSGPPIANPYPVTQPAQPEPLVAALPQQTKSGFAGLLERSLGGA